MIHWGPRMALHEATVLHPLPMNSRNSCCCWETLSFWPGRKSWSKFTAVPEDLVLNPFLLCFFFETLASVNVSSCQRIRGQDPSGFVGQTGDPVRNHRTGLIHSRLSRPFFLYTDRQYLGTTLASPFKSYENPTFNNNSGTAHTPISPPARAPCSGFSRRPSRSPPVIMSVSATRATRKF